MFTEAEEKEPGHDKRPDNKAFRQAFRSASATQKILYMPLWYAVKEPFSFFIV